jgi:ABC-type glycerol-3-phosphate transport system substrate-binding protein
MLSEDVDLSYHENLNFLPAQPRVFAKPPFNDHFAWTVFAEQLEMTRTMPLCVTWREIQTDALVPELEAAWIGQKSPQEALDAAAERAMERLQA